MLVGVRKAIADFKSGVRADARQTGEGKKRCYIAEWSDTEELGRRASISVIVWMNSLRGY